MGKCREAPSSQTTAKTLRRKKRSRAGCIRNYGDFWSKGVIRNREKGTDTDPNSAPNISHLVLVYDLAVPVTMSRPDQAALQAQQQAKFIEYVER